jgi:hypothetical protein
MCADAALAAMRLRDHDAAHRVRAPVRPPSSTCYMSSRVAAACVQRPDTRAASGGPRRPPAWSACLGTAGASRNARGGARQRPDCAMRSISHDFSGTLALLPRARHAAVLALRRYTRARGPPARATLAPRTIEARTTLQRRNAATGARSRAELHTAHRVVRYCAAPMKRIARKRSHCCTLESNFPSRPAALHREDDPLRSRYLNGCCNAAISVAARSGGLPAEPPKRVTGGACSQPNENEPNE